MQARSVVTVASTVGMGALGAIVGALAATVVDKKKRRPATAMGAVVGAALGAAAWFDPAWTDVTPKARRPPPIFP